MWLSSERRVSQVRWWTPPSVNCHQAGLTAPGLSSTLHVSLFLLHWLLILESHVEKVPKKFSLRAPERTYLCTCWRNRNLIFTSAIIPWPTQETNVRLHWAHDLISVLLMCYQGWNQVLARGCNSRKPLDKFLKIQFYYITSSLDDIVQHHPKENPRSAVVVHYVLKVKRTYLRTTYFSEKNWRVQKVGSLLPFIFIFLVGTLAIIQITFEAISSSCR